MTKEEHLFRYDQPFQLEAGGTLNGFHLKYTTLGRLNADRSNVVWVVHALTGNADVTSWWPGLFEPGSPLDPARYFIICANTLGGCYGSTGPLSLDPATGDPYYHTFPLLTNRDVVRSFDLLRASLGLERIHTVIGSSLGGQQALEWSILRQDLFEHLVLIATNAIHSPWGIAFNEAQRMAIEADETWKENDPRAGQSGLRAARAIGMLSYRSYEGFAERQSEKSPGVDNFRAASYQRYQGQKLALRFNAFTYRILSKAMDSHNVGRSRTAIEEVLAEVKAKTLVVGIPTDILFPLNEQEFLAEHIPGARLEVIHSVLGHDGFLVEFEQLRGILARFYQKKHSLVES